MQGPFTGPPKRKRSGPGRPPRDDFAPTITFTLPEALRQRLNTFHKSCGIERYPAETLRELLDQALSGDAVETAAIWARREVYRQIQSFMMSRMAELLNQLKAEIDQTVIHITDSEVHVQFPEDT